MNYMLLILLCICLILSACNTENVKRGGFEMMQNIHQHHCMRDNTEDCPQREDYHQYQQKRKEVQM